MAMARIDMHVFVHTKVLLILCTFIGGVPLTHIIQPFNHQKVEVKIPVYQEKPKPQVASVGISVRQEVDEKCSGSDPIIQEDESTYINWFDENSR